jgi:hypothetical protein
MNVSIVAYKMEIIGKNIERCELQLTQQNNKQSLYYPTDALNYINRSLY